jgi:hypothetical protein
LLGELISTLPIALLWAGSMGATLGLASGLVMRPYLSTQKQQIWLVTNTCCGMLTLLLAVFLTHPLPTVVPSFSSSLVIGAIVSAGWGLVPGALLVPLLQTLPPAKEEEIQQHLARANNKRHRWTTRGVTIIIGIATAVSVYHGRCQLMLCQPATWTEVLQLVQTHAAQAGPNYQVGMIRANPAFRSDLTADGPSHITIRIDLISSQPELPERWMYTQQTIEFEDRQQWVRRTGRYGTSEQPSLESQQRLNRIRISPRDVYRITWQAAQRELSTSISLTYSSMNLYTDGLPQERFGVESAWVISYHDDKEHLTYWIDAQTGEIVEQTKEERFKKP